MHESWCHFNEILCMREIFLQPGCKPRIAVVVALCDLLNCCDMALLGGLPFKFHLMQI